MQMAVFALSYFSDVRTMNLLMIQSLMMFMLIGMLPSNKSIEHEHLSANPDTIFWEARNTLDRNDFRGSEPYISQFAAYTYTIILMEYDVRSKNRDKIEPKFSIRAAFNPKKSWISKSSKDKPDRVLMHEQVHFDIAEITARNLRNALESKVYTRNFRQEINIIYKREIRKGEEMQKAYDSETNHGLDAKKQQYWAIKVEKLIQKASGKD